MVGTVGGFLAWRAKPSARKILSCYRGAPTQQQPQSERPKRVGRGDAASKVAVEQLPHQDSCVHGRRVRPDGTKGIGQTWQRAGAAVLCPASGIPGTG